MSFIARLQRAREILEQQDRLSRRALERELEIGGDELEEIIEELVDVQQLARREGRVLVWVGRSATAAPDVVGERPIRTPAPTDRTEARKVVTIIFADMIGSTSLHERLDAESARRLMERYYAALGAAVDAHGGTVVKLLGDGVMAAFGVPQVAEDDAIRAVHAAVAMQDAFRALLREQAAALGEVGLRVAVNTGEVVVSGANDDVVGDPVNIAARLQEQGGDGDVVIGEATRRLVATLVTLAPLGSIALKGRAETVKAYRIASLDPPAGTPSAPFVGRDDELARLDAVYDGVVAKPAAGLAVLVGSPGLGKSRLIDEFSRRATEGATVVRAHCNAAGGATFAPLADALRALLGIEAGATSESLHASVEGALPGDDADRARIAGGIASLLSGSPAAPEETFFVIRRLLTGLAAAEPVVLVIDDLQWAEPLLLDLVEHLVQWGSGVRLLILIGARPELRDLRSSLVIPGALVADVVTLEGLDAGAAMRLAANVIGAADLPAAVAAKVLATSEGNPLFVGELVRMLVQEGALTKEGERWTIGASLDALEMPPTIHALLAARIERLGPEERSVLERAAVVGRHFSRSAVAALLPGEAGDLDARLEALRRSELIEPDTGWLLGEPVLRFHHVLIRDAAYRRLLKGTRAELHERLADWIEARAGDAAEHDETIGWHLEQAHQHLLELGPVDDQGRSLGERAASRLATAGRRALARDDVPLAASLLGRAIERLESDASARPELLLDWCEAALAAGDIGPAAKAIDELGRFIDAPFETPVLSPGEGPPDGGGSSGRADEAPSQATVTVRAEEAAQRPSRSPACLRAWHTCFAGQLTVLTVPEELQAAADAVAGAAAALAQLGDSAGEAKAYSVHAQALARLGRVGACEAALDKALAAARKAGDRRRANAVLAGAPLAALWGPSPVTRASGRCLDVVRVLRITQGAPAVEAVALSCQGVLEALRGRTDAARRMLASARTMVEELGIMHRLFEVDGFAGRIAAMEGDTTEAERLLRGAYEGLRDLGLGIDAAQAVALLGRTLLAQDRAAEAETLSHESEALAGDDLQAAIAWRGVRAEALARRGEHAAALELAEAAVAIAGATDALLDHADARLALAAALRAAGRGAEADAEERRALELWEAKGATLLAERARHAAAVTEPVASAPAQAGSPMVRRHVRSNAATATIARVEVAVAARDFDACRSVFSESYQETDHPTGSTYGPDAAVASLQRLFRSRDPSYHVELLATLGTSLSLVRRRSHASGATSGRYDVGEYENEAIQVFEVDERGLLSGSEVFAADRLGDAIDRLYERHAEQLPDGPARERAAAIARSVPMTRAANDVDRFVAALAADVEIVDHRTLGTWNAHGADAMRRHMQSLQEVADDMMLRDEDVLALEAGALLVRRIHTGTERQGGGAYERPFLIVRLFGGDGLVTRWEWFDVGREAEALARFDELTAIRAATRPARRVRANAGTRNAERYVAAIAARDADAVMTTLSEDLEAVYHPTGSTYGAPGLVATWRRLFRASRMVARHTPLATLGNSLVLLRASVSHAGAELKSGASVGPVEVDQFILHEVDERGRVAGSETFADDHLGDAIARLYERYAEQFPGEAERHRAAATARAVPAFMRPFDLDLFATALAPTFESLDHRLLGTWSSGDAGAMLAHLRAMLELASDVAFRIDDVLALEPHAFLLRVTSSGTVPAGGGAYERPYLVLTIFGSDGLAVRSEFFDVDREAEALARFDEVVEPSGEEPVGSSRGPTWSFPNAATRSLARQQASFLARDWQGVADLLAAAFRFSDRRSTAQLELDRDQYVDFTRLADMPSVRLEIEVIATRGDRLALARVRFERAGGDVGPSEVCHLNLLETDEHGDLATSFVRWDEDDLDAAYEELDRRYEAGDGATLVLSRAFHQAFTSGDWQPVIALCAPGFVEYDHRHLAVLGTTRGAEAWVQNFSALADLAPDTVIRFDHVQSYGRGQLFQLSLRGTREGGEYEIPVVGVTEVDENGRFTRIDIYDIDQIEQVHARFAELAAPTRFATAATRSADRQSACIRARAWNEFEQLIDADFSYSDRRRMVRIDADRDGYVKMVRALGDMTSVDLLANTLASRGDRLVLRRARIEVADGDVGPSDLEHLNVNEVNEHGEFIAIVRFDPDDLDAAYDELDRRYEAGEGAAYATHGVFTRAFLRAIANRDWDPMIALSAPAFVEYDHRHLAVLGTTRGAEAWVQNFSTLADLAPDTIMRFDHLRFGPRGFLFQVTWQGTREGGDYEIPLSGVIEVDGKGRFARADIYDLDQLEQVRARFAELAAPPRFATAATRSHGRLLACFRARDWTGFTLFLHADFRFSDRRRLARIELGRDEYVQMVRALGDMSSVSLVDDSLATRGERLVLNRDRIEVAGGDVGPSDLEHLNLNEVNEHGEFTKMVRFDVDDLDAAYAELDARFLVGEAAAHPLALAFLTGYQRLFAVRDWDALRALLSSDLVAHDHRLVSWGTLDGPVAMLGAVQAQIELAPDTQERFDHVRTCERGLLYESVWYGTREGGAFENLRITVIEVDAQGRLGRVDIWDAEKLEQGHARFEEIAAATTPTALPPPRFANAAAHAAERANAYWSARDWERLVQMIPVAFRFHDRRPISQLELDRDELIAFTRTLGDMTFTRNVAELVATRGDRLALVQRRLEVAGGDVGPSEICQLDLFETDERGDVTALVRWDVDSLDAAYAELDARWEAGEGAAHAPALAWSQAYLAALDRRDWHGLAALLSPRLVGEDHRLVSWGTLRGPTVFLEPVRAMIDLAPDVRSRSDHARTSDRGLIVESVWVGTHDGGLFESPYLAVVELDSRGRAERLDLYDPHHLDAALTRFAEIRASAPAAPLAAITKPNAASALMDRWLAALLAAFEGGADDDWDAMRALCAPGLVFEDRQRLARVSGDREMMIASARERAAAGARPDPRLIGTAGDRIALFRNLYSGGPAGGRFEIEFLVLMEIDAAGLYTAIILFDPADARAVQREAWARWVAIDPAVAAPVAAQSEFIDGWNAQDRDRILRTHADDVVVEDHRDAGMGRIEGVEAYADSVVALWQLAPDSRLDAGWFWLAIEPHGGVIVARRAGTLADGGAFESDYLVLFTSAHDCVTRIEMFEIDAIDAALARFEELRPDPVRKA